MYKWTICLPDGRYDVEIRTRASGSQRGHARVLTAQLQNKKIARTGLAKNGYVVIVPRDKRMTDLAEFASLNNDKTLDERPWNSVRGVGDVVAKDVVVGDVVVGEVHYAAITEENLLGGAPDPAVGGGAYAEGYSTTSHEFAHMIHRTALTDADRTVITGGYTAKKNATDDYTQATADVWVDGPRINPIVFDSWKSEILTIKQAIRN